MSRSNERRVEPRRWHDAEMPSSKTVASGVLKVVGIVVAVVLLLVVVVVGWFVYQVVVPENGDRAAAQIGERRAVEVADELDPGYSEPLDAENLAQRIVDIEGVTVLAWEGDSGADGGAVVEVAVRAEVDDTSDEQVLDAGRSAGSSLTCWRYTVHAYRHDGAGQDEVDCPDDLGAAPTPDPTPLPSLDPDAEATVLGVLDDLPDGVSASDAEAALVAAFPDFVVVHVEEEAGEIVAAVGVQRSKDCVVGVRPDGEPAWRYLSYDRIQLELGEGGCTPALYRAPITTH